MNNSSSGPNLSFFIDLFGWKIRLKCVGKKSSFWISKFHSLAWHCQVDNLQANFFTIWYKIDAISTLFHFLPRVPQSETFTLYFKQNCLVKHCLVNSVCIVVLYSLSKMLKKKLMFCFAFFPSFLLHPRSGSRLVSIFRSIIIGQMLRSKANRHSPVIPEQTS